MPVTAQILPPDEAPGGLIDVAARAACDKGNQCGLHESWYACGKRSMCRSTATRAARNVLDAAMEYGGAVKPYQNNGRT